MQPEVYLDHAATTPGLPPVAEAMAQAMLAVYGNPSSLHRKGIEAEAILKKTRERIAASMRVSPAEIVFTSGGTEGNALAIRGAAQARQRRGRHIITSAIEHSSVLNICRALEEEGYTVTYLSVDDQGRVDPDRAAAVVTERTTLMSVMLVNNEIGTIQPVARIIDAVRRRKSDVLVHVDAVQAFGKIPVLPRELGADYVTISGHKIHGPKGIGALYRRKGAPLAPLFGQGSQEEGVRPGTENVPGIAGLGAALAALGEDDDFRRARLYHLRRRLIDGLLQIEGARLNGPKDEDAAPHIANFSFPGIRGEVLLHALEERGVYVSTGSACTSRKPEPSHVLKALGLPKEALESSIRVSLSWMTTEEEIDRAVAAFHETVSTLRLMLGR